MSNRKFTTDSLYDWLTKYVGTHNNNRCWLWPYTTSRGYGHIKIKGSLIYVHRVAFKLAYGRYPTPCGLHKCDVRACFNPRHIFEGTNADNVADMIRKGRQRGASGERNGHAVFTAETVRQIRLECRSRHNGYQWLARKYGVTRATIRRLVLGKSWRSVT